MKSEEILRIFEPHGAARSRAPIRDYGRLHARGEGQCEVSPRSTEEVAAIVRKARTEGVPLRVRGGGHSMNASSIPREEELLVRTDRLCEVRCLAEGAVSAGAGTVLWTLDEHLRSQGWKVPVLNDGSAGPTVGGYVAAGGYGLGSGMFGGFWENVIELTVVDGRGEARVLRPEHGLFLWLFGAMGQLGIVTEATLSVVPVSVEWPGGRPDGATPAKDLAWMPRASLFDAQRAPLERLFWFTFFVPGRCLSEAKQELAALRERHAGLLAFRPDYATPVRCRGRMPKLVFPRVEPFFAMGIWGDVGEVTPELRAGLQALDRAATELAIAKGYRRYVQTEIACSPATYRACFGDAIYADLGRLKGEMDPDWLFGRGAVFPPSLAPP